ncbi:MAG: hypothetical protein KC619_09545 [Myxococcales bacterium]|nr:hypothetical protein [Myxococcales bacterium]
MTARAHGTRPAIGLAALALVGCVAPVGPAACAECDPVTPADACVGQDCASCFETLDQPDRAALVRAADGLEGLADTLEATLAAQCDVMVGQLALRNAPVGLAACAVVADEVERRIREVFPRGVALSIAAEPALCRVPLEEARACAARCGDPGAAVTCDGDAVGECAGRCRGTCHGSCGDTCEGTCSDFCDGDCDATCTGFCDGECAILDRDLHCVVACDGRCDLGACNGTCRGECSGVCTEACDDTCTGTCVGECDAEWLPSCAGVVAVGSEACGLACTAAAAMAADCPTPEVRVRGPEADDPRDHGLIDQLVLTVGRYFEPLYAVEARIRVTLDPWMDALADALAEAPPEECLPDRASRAREAIGRLRAVRDTIRALATAADETVGEKLD